MSPALWQALLVNFLFWTGLAIGAVVFAALLELTDAAWAHPLRPIAERSRWFLSVSLAIYIGAFAAARAFAWRDLLVLVLTYTAAFWFCQVARLRTAIVLLVVYAIAFSVIAIDVVMSLEPGWVSTLFPAYFFSANVYGGIAAVAVVAAFAVPREMFDTSLARDLRSVLLGFALFWMYFTWTQFLVIWYGNLPTDTGYVIKRLSGGWQTIAWIVFALRCALPVVVLLTPVGKRRMPLAVVAAAIVAGFWIECWLLVAPDVGAPAAPLLTAVVTAGFAVLFAGSFAWPASRPRGRAAPLQPATAAAARPNSL